LNLPQFSQVHGIAIAASLAVYFAMHLTPGRDVGIPPLSRERLEAALRDVVVAGRFVPHVRADGALVIDDCYNANPQSMTASLHAIRELQGSTTRRARIIAVLGEMRELGFRTQQDHETLGQEVVAAGASILITCGGATEHTARVARQAGIEVHCASSAVEAAQIAVNIVQAGDWVLVKASRGVAAEVVVDALMNTTNRNNA
jgi:UDP-N-acetylmuramoyl-tripeptide--D-alanyl-D-alanine ligase